jgi:hypothetical protein
MFHKFFVFFALAFSVLGVTYEAFWTLWKDKTKHFVVLVEGYFIIDSIFMYIHEYIKLN